jgi:hypothetical protein
MTQAQSETPQRQSANTLRLIIRGAVGMVAIYALTLIALNNSGNTYVTLTIVSAIGAIAGVHAAKST